MDLKIKEESACRLCLNIVDTELEVIDEGTKKMMDFLILKVDLDVYSHAVICKTCVGCINEAFNFKLVCLGAEDSIRSFHTDKSGGNVVLTELYGKYFEDNLDMCRLCLKLSQRCDFVSLDDLLKETLYMPDLFSVHMPEMDLNIVKNPVICKVCQENLKNYLSLTQKSRRDVTVDSVKEITLGNIDDDLVKIEEMLHIKQEVLDEVSCKIPSESCRQDSTDSTNGMSLNNEAIKTEEAFDIKIEAKEYPSEVKKDTSDVEHKCPMYNYAAKSTQDLDEHVPTHKIYKCEACSYTSHYIQNFNRHRLLHKKTLKMYKCTSCNYEAKHKHVLKQHVRVHKSTPSIPMYKCTDCAYETNRRYSLKRHVVVHKDSSDIKLFKCAHCTYETRHKHCLVPHMVTHQNASKVEMHKCTMCSYVSRCRRSLNMHKIGHKDASEVEMYKCTMCTYASKYRPNIQQHILTHKDSSEVEIYKCTKCTYETKYKQSLRRHLITHKDASEVETYKCTTCNYESKFKRGLKLHILMHKNCSEVEMYKCEACTFQTRYKPNIKRHALTCHKSHT